MSRTTRRAPAASTHGPIPGATVGDRRPPRRTMEVRVGKRHDRLWACPSRLACQHRVDPTAFTRRPALRIVSRTGPARARPWGHQCAGLAFGPKETEQPADLGKSEGPISSIHRNTAAAEAGSRSRTRRPARASTTMTPIARVTRCGVGRRSARVRLQGVARDFGAGASSGSLPGPIPSIEYDQIESSSVRDRMPIERGSHFTLGDR
jgi:hypothetical protein